MLGKTHFAFYQTHHLKNRLRHLTNLNAAVLPLPAGVTHELCSQAGPRAPARPRPLPGRLRTTHWTVTDRRIPWALLRWLWVSLFLDLFSFPGAGPPPHPLILPGWMPCWEAWKIMGWPGPHPEIHTSAGEAASPHALHYRWRKENQG